MSRIYWNEGWQFFETYGEELNEVREHGQGIRVRLPHTCKELPFHYFDESEYQMVCAYRKIFRAPTEWAGKQVLFTVEAAAHQAEIYLNGHKIAEHRCGYTAFTADLTQHLKIGDINVLVIKVDTHEDPDIPPFGHLVDYMTYGGIYREVYIEIKEEAYIRDVFVRYHSLDTELKSWELCPEIYVQLKGKLGEMYERAEVASAQNSMADLSIRQYLQKDGEEMLLGEEKLPDILCESKTEKKSGIKAKVKWNLEQIWLWTLESPELYTLRTELLYEEEVIDENRVRFGFRTSQFRPDGYYLNGEKVHLQGMNRHQSYPYVGYAMPASMQKLDADILKWELGCNAVRTSHYPQSHYFLERCDEIGLLVFMEMPGWQHIGDEVWKEQALSNEREMISQYRNHTSIILWGVRINESADDDSFYQRTNALAHFLDDVRPTSGVRAHKKSNLLEDVYAYNDFLHDGLADGCEPKANVTTHMEKPYLVSEYNGHMYPCKAYDDEAHRVEHALRHARVLDSIKGGTGISGGFAWCMFDYNTHKEFGAGDRVCYHGVMDMFRNPKLAAMVYASQSTEDTVLEVSSSMEIGEHPACRRGKVYIFTNADSVKMYKNDLFIKEYTQADSPFQNLAHGPILVNDVFGDVLQVKEMFSSDKAEAVKEILNYMVLEGNKKNFAIVRKAIACRLRYGIDKEDLHTLYHRYVGDWGDKATVYRFEAIKDGKVVKTVIKEPMTSAHLEIQASTQVMKEQSSYDVAEVRIRVCDQNRNQLYYYNDTVTIECTGPIELIGPSALSLQGGMAAVYVKTNGNAGEATVTIGNEQLGYSTGKIYVDI